MIIMKYSNSQLIKILFVGFLFSVGVLCLLFAFLALFNVVPITFNNKQYFGITGFMIGILFIPFISFCTTLGTAPFLIFGLWIARKMFPKLFEKTINQI